MNEILLRANERNDAIAATMVAQEAACRLARRVTMIESWTKVFTDLVSVVSWKMGSLATLHVRAEGDSDILVAAASDWRMTVDESYPSLKIADSDEDAYFGARLTIDGLLGEIGVYQMPSGTYYLPLKAEAVDGRVGWALPAIYELSSVMIWKVDLDDLTGDLVEAVATSLREVPNVKTLAARLAVQL